MGLFDSDPAVELIQLLEAMQLSTLRSIDQIKPGDFTDERVMSASKYVAKIAKKKGATAARQVLATSRATPVPQGVFFGAAAPTRAAHDTAAQSAAAALDAQPGRSPAEQAKLDGQWAAIIDLIAARSGLNEQH